MQINPIKKGALEYIVVDDYFSEEEVLLIKQEIVGLQFAGKVPEEVGAAKVNNKVLKKGKGIFLNDFYRDWSYSPIIKTSKKLFSKEIYDVIEPVSIHFNHIRNSTYDSVLLNYYYNKDEYLPHTDKTVFTGVTMFKIGEIEGGDIHFPEFNETVKFKENRMVLFPGCLVHHAMPIKAEDNACRVTIAHFIRYKDDV